MGSSCLLLSGAGVLRVAQGVPQAWLGVTWGDAHRLRPTPPTVAMTPRALQVKVKRHVQLILERLLHTVNRRVIVLERDNSLRVSYHRLRWVRDRSASPGDEEVREGLHDVGMGSRWQTFLGGAVASDSSCWGWVCGYLTQQDARGSPKKGRRKCGRSRSWSRGSAGRSTQGVCDAGSSFGSRCGGLGCILWKTVSGPYELSSFYTWEECAGMLTSC